MGGKTTNKNVNDSEIAGEEALVEQYRIRVDAKQEPLRIDKFLMQRIAHVSRTKIQAAAEAESILVNGKPVKSNYKVKPQDEISVLLPEREEQITLQPEHIPLDIIYEDEDLLVVNKPAGLVVHPGVGNYSGTLVNGLLFHFGALPQQDEHTVRPGLVHRIDKDTSGLLVVAKNDLALAMLARQFFAHSVQRNYVALVWGSLPERSGTITGNIGRHPRYRKLFSVHTGSDSGKPAVTHYEVLEDMYYVSLVNCTLETGRTHQIRVHMQFAGHPVFGDPSYGGDAIVRGTIYSRYRQFVENCFRILPRQALHAQSLGFIHPRTGEHMYFEAPLPADFASVLEKWRAYTKNISA